MFAISHSLYALPLPYAGLPYVDDVERFDETGDGPLFSEIADILVEADLEDTFGVSLLHVHFALGAGEVVWESHDRRANTLSTEVCTQTSVLSRGGLPTSWRFLDGRWLPLAFARHGLGEADLSRAAAAMERIGRLLEEAGQAGRFGLCLAQGGLRSWPLRIHVERTDEAGRRQILAPDGSRCATAGRISIHRGRSGLRCWHAQALSATPARGAAPSARPHASSGASTVPGMTESRTKPVRDQGIRRVCPC